MRQRDVFEGRNNGGLAAQAEEVAAEAESRLQRMKDRALGGAKVVDTRVRGFASDHPVVTLLMAVGIGYGLGYLIYRRARAED